MKITDIKNKSKIDLTDLLFKKREELRKLNFNVRSGKVKNVKSISETKKDIARILTILKNNA